jgi:hypothetical protein
MFSGFFLECGENTCRTNIGVGTGRVEPSWYKPRHQNARKIAFFSLWDILRFPCTHYRSTRCSAVYWQMWILRVFPPPPKKKKRKCGYETEAERNNIFPKHTKHDELDDSRRNKAHPLLCNFVLNVNDSMFTLSGQLLSPVAEVGYASEYK